MASSSTPTDEKAVLTKPHSEIDHEPSEPSQERQTSLVPSNDNDPSETDSSGDQPPLPDEMPPLPDEQPPPLPSEPAPPLPDEPAPDDGWEPLWDANAQAFYFFNRITKASQWENPRVPSAAPAAPAAPVEHSAQPVVPSSSKAVVAGGYNPAIHGDYDPNADYAVHESDHESESRPVAPVTGENEIDYEATGAFNRFTGRWQAAHLKAENFSDESKSARQMNVFFDVDAAANSHDGRSLKAERRRQKLSRNEIKAYKEKTRAKKEAKRRAWLED
jgi:WW domain